MSWLPPPPFGPLQRGFNREILAKCKGTIMINTDDLLKDSGRLRGTQNLPNYVSLLQTFLCVYKIKQMPFNIGV